MLLVTRRPCHPANLPGRQTHIHLNPASHTTLSTLTTIDRRFNCNRLILFTSLDRLFLISVPFSPATQPSSFLRGSLILHVIFLPHTHLPHTHQFLS
jgi:hypothetical protein